MVKERERITELCNEIKDKSIDPFKFDVGEALNILNEELDKDDPESMVLDAGTLELVADIVSSQDKWIRNRLNSIFIEPMLLELKIRTLNEEELADIFLRSWKPCLNIEQITERRIKEAVEYLERPRVEFKFDEEDMYLEPLNIEQLAELHIFSGTAFEKDLKELERELKEEMKDRKELDYWEFINNDGNGVNGPPVSRDEKVKRAYLLSFILSDGGATLDAEPLEDRIFIRKSCRKRGQFTAFPIRI